MEARADFFVFPAAQPRHMQHFPARTGSEPITAVSFVTLGDVLSITAARTALRGLPAWKEDPRMRLRTIACALVTVMLLALSMGSAAATTAPTRLQTLAQQQTNLLLQFYEGENVSPPKCGQGQGSDGIDGAFLLPVASFTPGDQTVNCMTTAGSVLVDLGGFVITEDNRFPESSWTLLNGQVIPFTRENLELICDDIIDQGFISNPVPATVDGDPITGPDEPLNSGVFTAKVNRHAQIPGGADLYADSIALGHPGRLATVYCGFKAEVRLSLGTHTIMVDYTGIFGGSTVFTYNITVKD
jgi:hypothetical protein